jgi:riboflavin transporter FmnP
MVTSFLDEKCTIITACVIPFNLKKGKHSAIQFIIVNNEGYWKLGEIRENKEK